MVNISEAAKNVYVMFSQMLIEMCAVCDCCIPLKSNSAGVCPSLNGNWRHVIITGEIGQCHQVWLINRFAEERQWG